MWFLVVLSCVAVAAQVSSNIALTFILGIRLIFNVLRVDAAICKLNVSGFQLYLTVGYKTARYVACYCKLVVLNIILMYCRSYKLNGL